MTQEQEPIDISHSPELLRLAAEVRRRNAPVVLRDGEKPIVAVVPIEGEPQGLTDNFASLRAAAGTWKDEDTDAMIEEIYEGRRHTTRPVGEL